MCAFSPDSASRMFNRPLPINGVVPAQAARLHLTSPHGGISTLIHLGIDTVSLHGKGFAAVDEGDVVAVELPRSSTGTSPPYATPTSPLRPIVVITPPGTHKSHFRLFDVSVLAPLFQPRPHAGHLAGPHLRPSFTRTTPRSHSRATGRTQSR